MRNSPRKNKGFQGWYLRNAVPVRGRKPFSFVIVTDEDFLKFEKCSPREGTETFKTATHCISIDNLRNAVPVRGRKHVSLLSSTVFISHLRNAVPVRGRKRVVGCDLQ